MNKVLIVTYYWPPSGGAGVQRWLKFSKYLPEYGWEPIILTVDLKYAAYPVIDYSLNEDLPSGLVVHSTRATDYFSIYKKDKSKIPTAGFANSLDDTLKGKVLRFIRGNFFLPDPRKGWNKYAYNKASELIEKKGIKHVVTTSPPHSTQLVGLKIKKKFPDIKWVADLRDPWTDIYYYNQFYPTFISKAIDSRLEKKVLKKADRIITVGESLKVLFSSKMKGISEKTEIITNGYDMSDFKGITAEEPSCFTITYVGTLSDIYPVGGLISALKKLMSEGKDFIIRFVGSVSGNARKQLLSEIPETFVEIIPYVTHNEAVKFMLSSSVLVLIIPFHISNKSILTGKLFEYIAAGKPVLCIGPVDGDAAEILKKCRAGVTVDYSDIENISEFLANYEHHSGLSYSIAVDSFSRLNLTKRLVEILSSNERQR